ncbi:MAG: sn-glycerol-3-phosphate ABC transporter ATP-binding protein UgpC [Phycisphaeraceae bacterium]|nr:sn-glycerol-3-phosphate ABC transporter ATP-binding protein UgpC [Phycisphaeraceae bacterium]
MAQVSLNQLVKSYDGKTNVVDGIDLTVGDGEFVVLVGPSGCGKSTTLRMVAGLEDITGGTITIGDREVNNVPPKDRDIAMVFQSYALYPHMTVYKNMAFGLKLRKMPNSVIDQRVQDAASKLGITHLLDRKPKALSGGQRQRVALGRAIVRDPACFLFDEPLSNLDAKLRAQTRAELKQLHQDLKTTSIYVTHDQEEAMTLGSRVVVMSGGHIQQAGTPLEVYASPNNRFVAGFIGMPPMNFIDGQVTSPDGQPVFEGGGTQLALNKQLATAAQQASTKRVVLGLRPEHFSLQRDASSDAPSIELQVRVVEPLGAMMDVYAELPDGQRILLRTEAQPLGIDRPATFSVAIDKAHLFEQSEYGKNLSTS